MDIDKTLENGKISLKSYQLQSALYQIDEMQYTSAMLAKGIPEKRIRKYSFARKR